MAAVLLYQALITRINFEKRIETDYKRIISGIPTEYPKRITRLHNGKT